MNDKPILFSRPMVRAIIDGRKTQTRRAFKLPAWAEWDNSRESGEQSGDILPKDPQDRGWYNIEELACPHGVAGHSLWVRETFFAYGRWETRFSAKKGRDEWHFVDMTSECDRIYQYAADAPDLPLAKNRSGVLPGWWPRPAIHMPRAASRITLDIYATGVERLQEISDADAEAEGIDFLRHVPDADETLTPRQLFECLWDGINEPRGLGWKVNPWVWAIDFRRAE